MRRPTMAPSTLSGRAVLCLALLCSASAAGADSPGWTLSLPRGAGGDTTIAVENRCAAEHEFTIDLSRIPWLTLRADSRVAVAGGATVTVPARVETGERDVGSEDGELVVRCESCARDPLCSQRADRIPSRLRVLWTESELEDEPDLEALPNQVLAVLAGPPERQKTRWLKGWREELGLRDPKVHGLTLRAVTLVRLRLANPGPLAPALRGLQADPRVLWAQPVYRYATAAPTAATAAAGDPYSSRQWAARHLGVEAAHRAATGAGVRIAVLDSGVDSRHPEIADRVVSAVDLVDGSRRVPGETHGTAVAGVLAATADNGLGIRGIAPGATLLTARVCAETSATTGAATGDTVTLARGLDWAAAEGAQIINISLAGPRDPLIGSLIERLSTAGVAVVAAAGNRTTPATTAPPADTPRYPAAYPAALSVSSLGVDGTPFPGARHGDWVELLAPGEEILTTVPGEAFRPMTGSSFAAPHVSAALALLLEQAPGTVPTEALARLRSQAAAIDGSPAAALRLPTPRASSSATRPD